MPKPLRPLRFFFSSRRRHTRFDCDWSSDVCSSDLVALDAEDLALLGLEGVPIAIAFLLDLPGDLARHLDEIGRASCRERVEMWVVGVAFIRKDEARIGAAELVDLRVRGGGELGMVV